MTERMRFRKFFCVTLAALLIGGCATQKAEASKKETKEAEIQQPQVTQTQPVKKTKKRKKKAKKATVNTQTDTADTTTLVEQPAEAVTPQTFTPKMPGKRISQVSVPGPYVAVTFDDGPSPANTPKILDILKRHNAKATFFVLGQLAAQHKGILARAVSEGHEVAAHTWSHIKMTGSSQARIISEMDRTIDVITEAIGRRPTLMRPPYGACNSHIQDLMMSRYGMSTIMWSVDTADWKHPGVSVVTNRAVGNARNGSIILLHDIHASTLAAVEGIVTGLQRRGFKLVTVSELIDMGRRAAQGEGVPATPAIPAPAAEQPRPDTAVQATPVVTTPAEPQPVATAPEPQPAATAPELAATEPEQPAAAAEEELRAPEPPAEAAAPAEEQAAVAAVEPTPEPAVEPTSDPASSATRVEEMPISAPEPAEYDAATNPIETI